MHLPLLTTNVMPRAKNSPLVRLEITLTPLQVDRLKALSDATYRTKTSIVQQALDELFIKLGTEIK